MKAQKRIRPDRDGTRRHHAKRRTLERKRARQAKYASRKG